MKIPIEEVLVKTCDIKQFEDIEGWDATLIDATIDFIFELHKAKNRKLTTSVLVAWDALEQKKKVILEEHFGRKNIVMFGLAMGLFGRMKVPLIQNYIEDFFKDVMGKIGEDNNDDDKKKE